MTDTMIKPTNTPTIAKCAKCKKQGTIVATSDDKSMCHRCLASYCSQMEMVMAKVGEQLCSVCPNVKAFLKKKPPVKLQKFSPLPDAMVEIGPHLLRC